MNAKEQTLRRAGRVRGVRGVRGVSDPRDCLSEALSVLEWRRGKRPERRFTGLFRGDLADITGGWRAQAKRHETRHTVGFSRG